MVYLIEFFELSLEVVYNLFGFITIITYNADFCPAVWKNFSA